MTTKPQAVQAAYNWAFNTRGGKNSPGISMLCANQILSAVELYGLSDACYEVLTSLLKGWIAEKRPSFDKPIKALARALQIQEEATVANAGG